MHPSFVAFLRGKSLGEIKLHPPGNDGPDAVDMTRYHEIDVLGEIWPPQWWPEGYTPDPANVIEGEVEDVAVGAWLTDEERAALAPPKKRQPRPGAPLLAEGWLSDLQDLLLERDSFDLGLNRPLFGDDWLAVTVARELLDLPPWRIEMFVPNVQRELSGVFPALTWILTNLERLTPQIERAVHKDYADIRLTRPAVLLTGCADPARPEWSFVVNEHGTDFGVHVELHGDTITDVWAGT